MAEDRGERAKQCHRWVGLETTELWKALWVTDGRATHSFLQQRGAGLFLGEENE